MLLNRRHTIKLLCGAALIPSTTKAETFSVNRPLMGTLFTIKTHTADRALADKASEEAFVTAAKINSVASDHIADGELLSFSELPYGKPHAVSETLFPFLLQAQYFARKTEGAFDLTLGPLTKLRRESRRRKSLPSPDVLATAESDAMATAACVDRS